MCLLTYFQKILISPRVESNNEAVTPLSPSGSLSHSDKDHNISAAFEVADISLALISLGQYSWGETSMVLGWASFPSTVSWLDFIDFKLLCPICSIQFCNWVYLLLTWLPGSSN